MCIRDSFHGSSDTEVICYLITRNRLRMGSIESAISKTMDVLEGCLLYTSRCV